MIKPEDNCIVKNFNLGRPLFIFLQHANNEEIASTLSLLYQLAAYKGKNLCK